MQIVDPSAPPARGHLRRVGWERMSYGLYAPRRVRTLAEELQAWQLVLPRGAAFSHLTAAELRGWWLPAPIPHPVFVGDSALRLKQCTRTELAITAGQHRRGGPLLRTVIPLLDPRSESAWESIMRVLHRAAEIEVTPQQDLFDSRGRFVARADLLIDGTRRLQEYDGAVHREGEVHANDLSRDRKLLSADFDRYGYTSDQVLRDGREIISGIDQLLGRSWHPRRLTAWNQLIERSLYGRTGRARAYAHWRRATTPEK